MVDFTKIIIIGKIPRKNQKNLREKKEETEQQLSIMAENFLKEAFRLHDESHKNIKEGETK